MSDSRRPRNWSWEGLFGYLADGCSLGRRHRPEVSCVAPRGAPVSRHARYESRAGRGGSGARHPPSATQKVQPSTWALPVAIRAADVGVGVFGGRWRQMSLPSASGVALNGPRFPSGGSRRRSAIPTSQRLGEGRMVEVPAFGGRMKIVAYLASPFRLG